MPVYAYACSACGNAFDVHQSFEDAALTVCDACGGVLRKQFGAIGVSFKGSGFYRTDSRAATKSGAKKSGAKSDSSSTAAAASSSSSPSSTSSSGPQPAAKNSPASGGGGGTVA